MELVCPKHSLYYSVYSLADSDLELRCVRPDLD